MQESEFATTWRHFCGALYSPNDFDHFDWLRKLVLALYRDVLRRANTFLPISCFSQRWKTMVPAFAFSLIFLVSFSFYLFYDMIIPDRWCNCACSFSQEKENWCLWGHFHGIIVLYLTSMVLWNYSNAVFNSPGFMQNETDANEITSILKQTHAHRWKSCENRGGFLCFNPTSINVQEERLMAESFFPSKSNIQEYQDFASFFPEKLSKELHLFPSPLPTYCRKCDVVRPPRCHHCSKCNRCVLQVM